MSGRMRNAIKGTNKGITNSRVRLSNEHILPRSLHSKGRKVHVEVQRERKNGNVVKRKAGDMVEISMSKKFGSGVNSPKQQVILYNKIKRRLAEEHVPIEMVKTLRLLSNVAEADGLLTTKLDIASSRELANLTKEQLLGYNKTVISYMRTLGKLGFMVGGTSFVPVRTKNGIKPVLADFKNIVQL